ncbi:uncharacterized protein METZ01_LOCUS335935, partial [marine metagenome]
DGRYMASVDNSGMIYYYVVSNHTLLWSYDTGAEDLREIDITANGSYVVTAHSYADSQDAAIFLFDREFTNDEPLWSYETTYREIYDVSISAQGNTIVMSTYNGGERVYVFDVSSSTPLYSFDDCTYTCYATADISADGKYFVNRGRYDSVRLYSKESSVPVWSRGLAFDNCCYGAREEIVKITWDGKYVVAATKTLSYDKVVVFNASTGNPSWFYTSEEGGDFYALTIARDGKTFAVSHTSGRIYIFNMTGTTPFLILDDDDFEYNMGSEINVDFNGDGKFLAVVTNNNGRLSMYDVANDQLLWFNDNNYHYYYSMGATVSIDGRYVTASGSE